MEIDTPLGPYTVPDVLAWDALLDPDGTLSMRRFVRLLLQCILLSATCRPHDGERHVHLLEAKVLSTPMNTHTTIVCGPDYVIGMNVEQQVRVERVYRLRRTTDRGPVALDLLRSDVRVRRTRLLDVRNGEVAQAIVRYTKAMRHDMVRLAEEKLAVTLDIPFEAQPLQAPESAPYVGYDLTVQNVAGEGRILGISTRPRNHGIVFPEQSGDAIKTFVLFHDGGIVADGILDPGVAASMADRLVKFVAEEVNDLDDTWHDPSFEVHVGEPRIARISRGASDSSVTYGICMSAATHCDPDGAPASSACGSWCGEVGFGRHGLPIRIKLLGTARGVVTTGLLNGSHVQIELRLSSTWSYDLPEGQSWCYLRSSDSETRPHHDAGDHR